MMQKKKKEIEKEDIRNLSWEELSSNLVAMGEKSFRAKQVFDWLYKKDVNTFHAMKNLSKELLEGLEMGYEIVKPEPIRVVRSKDKTIKVLFQLRDGLTMETVYIPTRQRLTVCVSTQVGCKFGCRFCASGLGGFVRNLTCAEILNQILYAKQLFQDLSVTNIVFMGIGEPLDNYDNLLKSIRILNDKKGLNIGARRITVSTCGIVPQMKRLSQEGIQIELAISLHGYDQSSRNEIMPVNQKYPFDELIIASQEYYRKTKRQITFEYVLIQDLTCSSKAVRHLKKSLRGFDCKLNLIPYNNVDVFSYRSPGRKEILAFQKLLKENGIHSTVRKSRGNDVSASCGQLRFQGAKDK